VGSRGKLNWNSKETREIRSKLKLSKLQKQVLVGKILGDGSLVATFTGRNYKFQVEHKKAHKDYVNWTAGIFKEWLLSEPKLLEKHNSWRFRTISHPELTEFQKIFYRNRRKIIPSDISKLLKEPISLAVWFMDDGGLSTSKSAVTISTHSFTKAENNLLIDCLQTNFKLQANLNWDGKGYRLYIPVKSIARFKSLVDPYILEVMKYKIPLTP
jgi:hypothetical protein